MRKSLSLHILLYSIFLANGAQALGDQRYTNNFFFYAAKYICLSATAHDTKLDCSLGGDTTLVQHDTPFGVKPGKAACRNFSLVEKQDDLTRKSSNRVLYGDQYATNIFRTYVSTSYSFFELRGPRHYATIVHIGNGVELGQIVDIGARSFQTDLLEYVLSADQQAGWEAHTAAFGAALFSPGKAVVFANSVNCDGFTILNFRVNERGTKAKVKD